MTDHKETDAHTGTDTTGHVWDGIRELDTPLPKWWLYTWLVCIVWAGVWCLLYPSVPFGRNYWHGLLGFSTRVEVGQEVGKVVAHRAGVMDKVAALSFEQIKADPELMAAVQTSGRITFANNCQPCHGAGGGGRVGYPALAAGSWLWGGKLADIQQTITYGIRSGLDDARDSQMPRFGADGILKPDEVQQVADYVTTLYQLPNPTASPASITAGKALFAANCVACHGENGEGNRQFGGPALASHVHLYTADRATIVAQINQPHMGVMPNWNTRLDPATIKAVTLYVHSLGGGE